MTVKRIVFDTETTGFESNSAIIQLAGYILYSDNGIKVREKFDIKMGLFDGAHVSDQALEVNGVSLEQLNSPERKTQDRGIKEFVAVMEKHVNKFDKNDKLIPVCHNAKFDIEKLKEAFNRQGNDYLGSYIDLSNVQCTYMLAKSLQRKGLLNNAPDLKLFSLCDHLGLDVSHLDAHEAIADVEATILLYNKLKRIEREGADL